MKIKVREHKYKDNLMFELVSFNVVSLIFETLLFVGFVAMHDPARFNLTRSSLVNDLEYFYEIDLT